MVCKSETDKTPVAFTHKDESKNEFWIFGVSSTSWCNQIYYMKIFANNGSLLRDYVPVTWKNGANDEFGLYDYVEGKFSKYGGDTTVTTTNNIKKYYNGTENVALSAAEYIPLNNMLNNLNMAENTEGQCLILYVTAKSTYDGLPTNIKNIFDNDTNYLTAVRDRFNAWKAANGDGGTNASSFLSIYNENFSSSVALITTIVFLLVAGVGTYFVIRKKKYN